ncbi:MAG: tetratricopeptide repeat protein [Lysobacter sp.]|nr:MAG: tetratricopeptide repeat protein [Lysobacter sp.]
MYDTVIAALRRGAADEALATAHALVAQQPDDLRALRLLAAAQRLGGDSVAALATLDDALTREPEDADLHLERAGLLLQARQLDEAQAALARSVGLDPNQFPAYIIQAQLALGRGEFDEAERLVRTAARIAPEHPQVSAVEGLLALRRGRPDEALGLLAQASQQSPDEPMLRQALGFAHLANGHLAFAEQAFRSLLQTQSRNLALKALIADLMRRQGRAAEAADELATSLADPDAPPALHRLVGELEVEAGRVDTALGRLKHALTLMPGDRRMLSALLAAWEQLDAQDDARGTLDAALATHPQVPALWLARLGIEPFADEAAVAVIDRWLVAMPGHVPALTARLTALDAAGDADGAEGTARRIIEVEPGHAQAEFRLLEVLMAREPVQAVERLRELEGQAGDPQVRRALRQMLGRAQDQAGSPDTAAATWLSLHAEVAHQRLPLPAPTRYAGPWPEAAPLPPEPAGIVLLWGAPGSMVERLVRTLEVAGAPVLLDRFAAQPPVDPLQRLETPANLVEGSADGAYLVAQWRAALAGRGVEGPTVFDWLPAWDNALLLALRPHLPEALLLIALRDPRDMLVDWLAHGSPLPVRFSDAASAATWLSELLEQVAELHEQALFPHRLLRLDGITDDPTGLAQVLADALELDLPVPTPRQLGPARLPAGHWRRFAGVLDEAFAIVTPVAQRLGYTA